MLSNAERQKRYRQKVKALTNLASSSHVEEYQRVRLKLIEEFLDDPDIAPEDVTDIKAREAETEGTIDDGTLRDWFQRVVQEEFEREYLKRRTQRAKSSRRQGQLW